MTDALGQKLRALLSTTRRQGPGRTWPRPLREKVARYVLSRRQQGATYELLAQTLGVPPNTLHRWSHSLKHDAATTDEGPFRRVQFVDEGASSMTLHGPYGLRVEGLDLDTLVALWKRLAS